MHAERTTWSNGVPKPRVVRATPASSGRYGLRWGVTREQAENNKVGICLQEIDGGRPFFLTMLGAARLNPNRSRPKWTIHAALGAPVRSTHMEIEHADPIPHQDRRRAERAAHTFFYLRDPRLTPPAESLSGLTPQQRAVYSATFFEQNESGRGTRRPETEIRQRAPDCVRTYSPKLDATAANPEDAALTGRLIDLDAFGKAIYQTLSARSVLNSTHIAEAARASGLGAAEDWYHDAFAQRRTLRYVARPDMADALTHRSAA